MKNSRHIFLLLLCCAYFGICQQREPERQNNARVVNLCDVLKAPAAFAGKRITVDAHIDSMKEGSSIWNPDCPKLRVVLVTALDEGPESGIRDLRQELAQYQKGIPVSFSDTDWNLRTRLLR
jgi:hypothetical protein